MIPIHEQEKMPVMDIIRAAIKEKHMKQKDFAAAIGKPASNVSSQMNDGYLKAEDWRKWAKALGYVVVMIPDENAPQ